MRRLVHCLFVCVRMCTRVDGSASICWLLDFSLEEYNAKRKIHEQWAHSGVVPRDVDRLQPFSEREQQWLCNFVKPMVEDEWLSRHE